MSIIDDGGNIALGQSECNGVYDIKAGKCSKFTDCNDVPGVFLDHIGRMRECK